MDSLENPIFFESAEQQETELLRERNRVAKRASRARQKQQENNESAPSKQSSRRRRSVVSPATTTGELLSRPFQPPWPTPNQVLDNSGSSTVTNGPSFSPAAPWDNSLGSVVESPDASQQLMMSSLSTTTPHSATSLPFNSVDAVSIPTHSNPSVELVYPSPDAINNSSTLLHIAIRNGTKGIVSSLIQFGADVNSLDTSGASPIHVAVEFRQLSVVELLLNHGANINARNSAQMTPLELAVRAQDEQTVDFLLSRGAQLY